MGSVIILGIFVADTTFRAERQPRIGETLLGKSFSLGPGGKGSNQAVAAARAGAQTQLITKIGQDPFGDMAMAIWSDAGVDPVAITRVPDQATGAAYIFVDDATGDNAIIVTAGVAGTLTPEDVRAQADQIRAADVFVTQLEQPLDAAMEGLRIAKEAGVTTILNPAPGANLPEGMLTLADIVTPNESEAEILTGLPVTNTKEAETAAATLVQQGAKSAIITLGENGSLYHDGTSVTHCPAINAGPLVETTGAGDAYNGALAAGLSMGQTVPDAIRFATAAAALSVTRPGTAPSMPMRSEIDGLLNRP